MDQQRGISGRIVVVAFVALVAAVAGGLWVALQDARREYKESIEAARASLAAHAVQPGWHRVTLDTGDEGALPFFVLLPAGDGMALIANGEETIEAAFRHTVNGGVLDFPHYDARVEFTALPDAGLTGTYSKTTTGGSVQMMAASAERVGAPDPTARFARFFGADAQAPADFSGAWRMEFADDPTAMGNFEQRDGGVLTGTIMTPTGDYRFLSGNVEGNQMRLSVFDGAHAFLFKGTMDGSADSFTGVFRSGATYHDTFTAYRDPDFQLPDPFREVSLRPGVTRLSVPELKQAPYKGAPTIVVAFGTWCPNCHDEAPVLKALYDEHRDVGLQILGLAYERTEDLERSARQIRLFKERYSIPWTIVPAGVSDKAKTAATLPDLTAFRSYPTTIFLNRDGTVRAIHSGFAGPATGEAHAQTLAEFERLIGDIVASPTP